MRRIFSIFRKFAATIFSRVITKKPAKIVRFTKIHQTLRNTSYLTWTKRSRIKLVVPPDLLKEENVCLFIYSQNHPYKTPRRYNTGKTKNVYPLIIQLFLNIYSGELEGGFTTSPLQPKKNVKFPVVYRVFFPIALTFHFITQKLLMSH